MPMSEVVMGEWRRLHSEELMIFTLQQILFGRDQIKKNGMVGGTITYWGEERSKQGFSEPEGKKSLGRPKRRWVFRKWDGGVWTGFILFAVGAGGVLLWMR